MGKTGYTCIRRTFCSLNVLVWVIIFLETIFFKIYWSHFNKNKYMTQICGSCFLGLGLWLKLSYEGYASLLPENAGLSADCILITFGVLSLIISFFGCCGSWFQSRCLLIMVNILKFWKNGFDTILLIYFFLFYSIFH